MPTDPADQRRSVDRDRWRPSRRKRNRMRKRRICRQLFLPIVMDYPTPPTKKGPSRWN
jgi:hypothetical protein